MEKQDDQYLSVAGDHRGRQAWSRAWVLLYVDVKVDMVVGHVLESRSGPEEIDEAAQKTD